MKVQLFNDNFQNFKKYGIPKAQLVIADITSPPAAEDAPPVRRGSAAEAAWMRPYIQRTAEKAKNSPSRIQREGTRKETVT